MKSKKSDLKLAREVAALIRRAIEFGDCSVELEVITRLALEKRLGNSQTVNDDALIRQGHRNAAKLWAKAGAHILYSERPLEMLGLITDVLTEKRTVRGGDYDDLIKAVYFDVFKRHIGYANMNGFHYSVWKEKFAERWPHREDQLPDDRSLRRSLSRLGLYFAPKYKRN